MKRRFLATFTLALAACLFAAINSPAAVHYVNANGMNPTPPYTNWTKAARSIQAAVNVASAGDTIIVTNGVYPGTVNVTNPLALVSVKGPQFTTIDGTGTVRCISLADGASLTGFSLRNGFAEHDNGGGVLCQSTNAFLTNCVITGNWADHYGGGVYGGALHNCALIGNYAHYGGGADNSILDNCVLTNNQVLGQWVYVTLPHYPGYWVYEAAKGGGAYESTLCNCTLTDNSANPYGGGACSSTLYNCLLIGNQVAGTSGHGLIYPGKGGGAYGSTLFNCTLTGNSATDYSGGAHAGTLYNCILYFNTANHGSNYDTGSTLNYCCTAPLATNGIGNITNAPLFVDTNGWSNLHLQTNSPGINAGSNAYVMIVTDLDGNPRIAGGTVDMGAYEFQPCITGGQFCDAACSRLTGFSFTFSGAIVGQPYRIQSSTNLAAGRWTDLTNFIYTVPIVIADPSADAGPRRFYRAVSP